MNIGFFTDTYLPQINGVANSVDLFRRELERRGHSVYVFAPCVPGYFEKDENVFRFKSIGLGPLFAAKGNFLANRLTLPFSLRHFRRVVDIKLDIIHSHTEMGMGTLASFFSKSMKIPHVHTYHTLYSEYIHYLAKGKLVTKKGVEKLSAMFCNRCDIVLAPSKKIRDLLWKYGVKTRLEVLETGMDLSVFELAKKNLSFREKYGIDKKAKVLLYVGRLGKEKSVDILLWAFAASEVKNGLLVLVGDGPERLNLEKLAESLGVSDRVLFTGNLPHNIAIEAYSAANLFLFASVTETQGLVLLEAAASGLPIIAINDPVVASYVKPGQNGILVNSAEEMAKSIKKFFDNPWEASKMGKVSQQVAADFSIQRQTLKLLDVYSQLLPIEKTAHI